MNTPNNKWIKDWIINENPSKEKKLGEGLIQIFIMFWQHANLSSESNVALPPCLLPDMTLGMATLDSGVTGRNLEQVNVAVKRASEETGWAYYPGNEKDSKGRVVSAIFYINDDRAETDNIDGNGKVPSQW